MDHSFDIDMSAGTEKLNGTHHVYQAIMARGQGASHALRADVPGGRQSVTAIPSVGAYT